jgi:hypothetical protein
MEEGRREIAKSAERSLYFFLSLSADPCTDLLPSAFELFAASGPLPVIIDFEQFFSSPSNAAFVELQENRAGTPVVPAPSPRWLVHSSL